MVYYATFNDISVILWWLCKKIVKLHAKEAKTLAMFVEFSCWRHSIVCVRPFGRYFGLLDIAG
jgi:hypothetical protein